ncbi:MAG TPA: HAMP domain-containing histidine kinase [Arcobacter sp.]|nr:HAMP domain-containing histidine kinase [Arcobacter sp.]
MSIFITISAILFYKITFNYEYDNAVSKLKMKAYELSANIIMQDMKGKSFKKKNFLSYNINTTSLYNKSQSLMYGIDEKILSFKRDVYTKNDVIYVVDKSTFGHLGIEYTILKDTKFLKENNVLEKTILIFGFIFVLMNIIGYFLSKLFLKPILTQREKLNNFIKDSTHELNTPVSALMMCVDSPNPTSLKNLERIKLSSKRISEIYKDLTYIFLDDSDINKQVNSINLKDLLDAQMDYFTDFAIKKKIKVNYEAEDLNYKIDEESFIRLSNNLISNAVKYTSSAGTITVKLRDNKLTVQDSGIGIAKEKQKDIFDRFYRATSNAGGFGIGLNIVQTICKKYDLKIELESIENEGSTFTVYFS